MMKKITEDLWKVGGGSWNNTSPVFSDENDCNVYLISTTERLILIDSGSKAGKPIIEKNIKEAGFNPEDISDVLLSHSHWDHCDSLSKWLDDYSPTLHMSDIGSIYFKNGDYRLVGYQIFSPDYRFDSFESDHQIKDGEFFNIGSIKIKGYSMPGHTPDSMVFAVTIKGTKIWICGDITFGMDKRTGKLGCIGWLNMLWESNLKSYKNSLEKMLRMDIPDFLLPGHGYVVSGKNNIKRTIEASLQTIKSILNDPNSRHFGDM